MSKSSIRKEIAALINSIKEHSDNIGDKEHIPQLELELILHKIEKLYQKSIVFNHLNSIPDEPAYKKQEAAAEQKKPEVTPEPKKEPEVTELNKVVDLFGSEVPPATEKPKAEKKTERKEEKKEEKPAAVVKSVQKPAIADLNKALGLNDKFLFANELFEGSMQEFNIAVQQLNTAETIESAMEYLGSLQQLYEWDMEKESVKRLIDLVDRRYS
jgi:hypothetical protein